VGVVVVVVAVVMVVVVVVVVVAALICYEYGFHMVGLWIEYDVCMAFNV
jgi:hypothetical protein